MTIVLQDERGFNQVFAPVGSTPVRARRRHDWFVAEAERFQARRILELGCGTGETAAYLAANTDADIVAVDISDKFLEGARKLHKAPNLRYEKFDLLGTNPLALGRFDLVLGNGILHHLVRNLDDVLVALRAISTRGGRLAFIEPNRRNPYCAFIFGTRVGRRWARLEPDEMAFTSKELDRALTVAGWSDIAVTTRDFLLPGLPKIVAGPILLAEPALEATAVTRWLAQSHFITAGY